MQKCPTLYADTDKKYPQLPCTTTDDQALRLMANPASCSCVGSIVYAFAYKIDEISYFISERI